eukprot:m.141132 g.141132  ORF g.141132 m.141132 type:complete len:107 (+) comp15972_c1_seq2:1043-1363(+)
MFRHGFNVGVLWGWRGSMVLYLVSWQSAALLLVPCMPCILLLLLTQSMFALHGYIWTGERHIYRAACQHRTDIRKETGRVPPPDETFKAAVAESRQGFLLCYECSA